MLIFLLKYATLIKIETSYDAMEDRVDCITVSLCRKVILRGDTVEAKCMQNLRPQTKWVSILMILLIDKCWLVFQLRDI